MTKETYLKIRVGDIIANKENQKILKQLLTPKKQPKQSAQELIDGLDTGIKGPRFDDYGIRKY